MERRIWEIFTYGEFKRIQRTDQVQLISSLYHVYWNKAKLLSLPIPSKYKAKTNYLDNLKLNEEISLSKVEFKEESTHVPDESNTLDSSRKFTFDNSWNKARKKSSNIHSMNPVKNKLTKSRSSSKNMVIMVQNYTTDKDYNTAKMAKSKQIVVLP